MAFEGAPPSRGRNRNGESSGAEAVAGEGLGFFPGRGRDVGRGFGRFHLRPRGRSGSGALREWGLRAIREGSAHRGPAGVPASPQPGRRRGRRGRGEAGATSGGSRSGGAGVGAAEAPRFRGGAGSCTGVRALLRAMQGPSPGVVRGEHVGRERESTAPAVGGRVRVDDRHGSFNDRLAYPSG